MPVSFDSWLQPALMAAGAVVLVWLVHRLLQVVIKHRAARGKLSLTVAGTLRRAVTGAAIVSGLVLALQALGLLQGAMTALTGMFAMIAIGFVAVWSVASNVSCALIMLVSQPFRVGDEIEFPPDDIRGKVVNFNMLYTTLKTDDAALLQIPNNMFFQRMVKRRPGVGDVSLEDQLPRQEDAAV